MVVILVFCLLFFTGCDNREYIGNCDVFQCIDLVNVNDSLDDVNDIVGFDGVFVNDSFYWNLSRDSRLIVSYNNSFARIEIDFRKGAIANTDVDFSRFSDIRSLLDSGVSLPYDGFVEMVGNVSGTLKVKTNTEVAYEWVKLNGDYLDAYFSLSDGRCTMVSGNF